MVNLPGITSLKETSPSFLSQQLSIKSVNGSSASGRCHACLPFPRAGILSWLSLSQSVCAVIITVRSYVWMTLCLRNTVSFAIVCDSCVWFFQQYGFIVKFRKVAKYWQWPIMFEGLWGSILRLFFNRSSLTYIIIKAVSPGLMG